MKRLKALLVNPWVYDFACYDLFNKPVGLLQIATCLKNTGFDITLIDCLDRFDPAMESFTGRRPAASACGSYYSEPASKPAVFKDIPRRYRRFGMPERLFKDIIKNTAEPDIILVTSGIT